MRSPLTAADLVEIVQGAWGEDVDLSTVVVQLIGHGDLDQGDVTTETDIDNVRIVRLGDEDMVDEEWDAQEAAAEALESGDAA